MYSAQSPPVITGCTFVANTAGQRGGGLVVLGGSATVATTTFALNDAPIGSALRLNGTSAQVSQSIFALQAGGDAVDCVSSSSLILNCSDSWSNETGDWVGCLAGLEGTGGNFTADPLFCSWSARELGLQPGSPCLPAGNACGVQIGSSGATVCSPTVPLFLDTAPTGLTLQFDGQTLTAPVTVQWVPGTSHTVGTTSPQLPVADERHTFFAWGDSGAIAHAVTAPDSADTLVATFTTEVLLTVTATAGGTVNPTGAAFHPFAAPESLEAFPDSGYVFIGWTGTGTGSYTGPDNLVQVVMHGPITQHASFSLVHHDVTMAADPGGTVTPAAGVHSFVDRTLVTIAAAPDTGWKFLDWTGTGPGSYSGTANPAQITVLGDIAQTAHFEQLPRYVLTMAADSGGTVTPATSDYIVGTEVLITATPSPGFYFTGWTGTGPGSYTGTLNPSVAVMDGDITQTAHFQPLPRYVLTMVADPGGTVSPPTTEYLVGTPVTITATPSSGFVFTGWTGTGTGSYTGLNNPASVTMNGDITQTAHFLPSFPLTMVADSGGTVSPASGDFAQGSAVTIQATPLPGYHFQDWTGSGPGSYTGTNNPATVTMDGAITQTAHFFRPATYPLTMAVGSTGGGTVQPASGDYAAGSSVQITAFPDPGYRFLGWLGTGLGSYSGIKITRTITMNSAITETAWFQAQPPVTLTMAAGPGGTVTPGSGTYPAASQVTINAVPDPGNSFLHWAGSGFGSYSGTNPMVTITLNSDVVQTAYFEYEVPVTITTNPPGLRIGVDGVDHVSPQTFQWLNTSVHTVDVDSLVPGLPGERQRFQQWADGTATAARTIDVPDAAASFSAAYAPDAFLDFVDPPQGVSLPGDSWHAVGTAVPIQAVPNPGHVFASWAGQGSGSYTGTNNPASVTMNGPVTQTPSYDSYGYELTISASSTDPYVSTRPPTGGASSLYLWMTCADVGPAALEADVSSTLPYSAFTPSPGVLNLGTATNLLLAVTGCPPAPFLLGAFVIVDTGGELCLVPSAANGRMGVVSCSFPNFLVDPVRLTGFSSSAQPPCYVPGMPCLNPPPRPAEPAASPPPVAAAPPAVFPDAFLSVHPNPFLGRTTVRFTAAGPGPARLAIYDVTGRLVRRVVERTLGAGQHEATWDGRGPDGGKAPAGVYFARLEVGALDETRKIVLLDGAR
jgi:uncharacterized repeat protein (TIGR02543 family)